MPQESQLAHRVLGNLALPYVTNVSPASTDPHFVSGSADILTSVNQYAERRPGFATAVETTPTVFNNLKRLFAWDRFDGTFIEMACDVNAGGFAQVFKRIVGTDASFVSIFTDTAATVFDFVVSNNTVYFSNGHVAKKWDPVNGLSNWGIAVGSVTSSVNAYCGTGANGTGAWTAPTNIQGAPDSVFTTIALVVPAHVIGTTSGTLNATNYGFTIPATNSILGIQVVITGFFTHTGTSTIPGSVLVNLFSGGNIIGSQRGIVLPGASANVTLGGSSDLWGTTLTPSAVNSVTFGLSISCEGDNNSAGADTFTFQLDAAQITVFQLGGPGIVVSGAAGTMTATAGYVYVFCYGNSNTGHISSPTPPSANTGVFTNKANVSVTLTASTDPQVNQIRLFRTTDGGGGTYFELPTSPYPNTTGAVLDSASDGNLQVGSIAPTPTFNDPPPPFLAPVYFSGRIWGFVGNKVYFSGLEEINQGVPEESFPSGIAGNFWSFDEPVQGLGVAGIGAGQTLGILCGGRLYGIQGNTLDTFRRFLVSNRRGCRNRTCVTSLGGMMAWLDTANQVWATDGNSLQELSLAIRPDLSSITQANCSLTFHTAGRFHWLVLSTGAKLFVYDIDQDQWMPPWNFSANYIVSEEVAAGNYVLQAATTTKALQMNPVAFNDNSVTYAPVAKISLLSVIPDYGTRFSYIGMGSYNEPTRTGVPYTFQVTNNGQALGDFKILTDEDPTTGAYTSIAANLVDTVVAFNRTNGVNLKQLVYQTTQPASRWVSMQVVLANADQVDNLYELFMAYKPLGGR